MSDAGLKLPPLIELALAYHRHPLRYPRLGQASEPLPARFAPLVVAFGQALAPSHIEATAASLGVTTEELVAAARFFVRHALLAQGSSPWRVLGLEGHLNLAQVRQHYHLLIRLFHPDRRGADPQGLDAEADTADAMRINAAYEQLRDRLKEGPEGADQATAPSAEDPGALRRFFQPQEGTPETARRVSYPRKVASGQSHRRWRPLVWGGGLAGLLLGVGVLVWALRESPALHKMAAEREGPAASPSTEVAPKRQASGPLPAQPAYLTQPLVGTATKHSPEADAKGESKQVAAAEAERLARAEAERLAEERRLADQQARREEAARQEAARQEAERQEAARQALAKQETARAEAARLEAARQEAARLEAARQALAKQETARAEAARLETARQEEVRQELVRQEEARLEAKRQEAARVEAARQEEMRLEEERQRAAQRDAQVRLMAEREAKAQARLAAELEAQARLVAEREALERELATQRLAQAQELEAQRLAHEQELAAQRQALQAKVDAEAKARQQAEEAERKAHQAKAEAERQALQAKAEDEAKAQARRQALEVERLALQAKVEAEAHQSTSAAPAKKPPPLPSDPSKLVNRLMSAYTAGELDTLVGLFTPDAKTTDGQGRNVIRADYKTLFATTSQREIDITGLRWDWRKDGRTVGTGALTVKTRAQGSRGWYQARGRIRLELVPWEGDWRIARMEYQVR